MKMVNWSVAKKVHHALMATHAPLYNQDQLVAQSMLLAVSFASSRIEKKPKR